MESAAETSSEDEELDGRDTQKDETGAEALNQEEYKKMTNTPVVAVRPPASCSQAQKDSSFLSVCPTGLAALDCRPLLNTSVEEIVRSPVALPHGLGSTWPIASGLC